MSRHFLQSRVARDAPKMCAVVPTYLSQQGTVISRHDTFFADMQLIQICINNKVAPGQGSTEALAGCLQFDAALGVSQPFFACRNLLSELVGLRARVLLECAGHVPAMTACDADHVIVDV